MIDSNTFYFGIHDENTNQTTFCLIKDTDNESFSDFTIEEFNGYQVLNEDKDVVESIAIDLTSFGESKSFDSVKGECLTVCKLSEEEYYSFLS